MAASEVTVERDEAASRFVLRLGGQPVGAADYLRSGDDVVVITHTEIQPPHERQGLGSALVAAALDQLRQAGERVVPRCPFVAAFIESHPEYAALVAGDGT